MTLADARIEFILADGPNHPRGSPVILPHIDGTDLRDLLRPVERAQGAGEGAGSYAGVPVSGRKRLDVQYLGRSSQDTYETTITVLGCTCGIVDCWPLRVHVSVDPEVVIWTSLENGCRPWDYGELGSFTFDRYEYVSGLDHIRATLAHDGRPAW